jgi:sec-independent protein translocase protein TatB
LFDISFSELALCFVVALVVLGPERLPKLARTLGRWSGQAKAYMRNLTTELERESSVAEIKKQFQQAQQALRETQSEIERSARELGSDVRNRLEPPAPPAENPEAVSEAQPPIAPGVEPPKGSA